MSKVLPMNAATGSVVVTVNDTGHRAEFGHDAPFSRLLGRAIQNGYEPASALCLIAEVGSHVWHPSRLKAEHADLRERWTAFFGEPGPIPNGSIIGSVSATANGRTSKAQIRGGDFYDTELLRAHLRGQNAAEAFLFLAEVGARLRDHNEAMLGLHLREDFERRFG